MEREEEGEGETAEAISRMAGETGEGEEREEEGPLAIEAA